MLRLCETHLEGFTLKRSFWQNTQTDQKSLLTNYILSDVRAQDATRSSIGTLQKTHLLSSIVLQVAAPYNPHCLISKNHLLRKHHDSNITYAHSSANTAKQ